MSTETKNQGEGNREAARNYNERAEKFAKEKPVEDLAEQAKPGSEQEREELEKAEREGKDRAKTFDPEVRRKYENK